MVRHPREDYKLTDIRDYPSVREFFESFEKLNKKLEPARQGAIERVRQKEEKEKLEAERRKIQAEKRRKEYEASPEYIKMKKDQKNSLIVLGGLVGIFVIIFSVSTIIREKSIQDAKRKALNIEEKAIALKREERLKRLE